MKVWYGAKLKPLDLKQLKTAGFADQIRRQLNPKTDLKTGSNSV